MKKWIAAVLLISGLLVTSTASASMVRVTDMGAERLVDLMQSIIAAKGLQGNLRITNVWRSRDMDIVKEHLYGWRCKYGIQNAASPDGDIVMWADEDGYVNSLRILYNKPDLQQGNSFRRLVEDVILQACGMSEAEAVESQNHYRKYDTHFVSTLWSNTKNRQYVIMIYPRIRVDNPSVSDWGLCVFANNDVNEAVNVPQDIVTKESYENGSWSQ